MQLTIDASVHLNALNPSETGSSTSRALLDYVFGDPDDLARRVTAISPYLLPIELAAALARVFDDDDHALALYESIRTLPRQRFVPLDEALASKAARLGAGLRLRGADAVYVAVAEVYEATLVTLDREQRRRASGRVPVASPAEILNSAEADQPR